MNSPCTSFSFESYTFEPGKKLARFLYKAKFANGRTVDYAEVLHLPKEIKGLPPCELGERALRMVHLMLGISYYKQFFAPKVELPYALTVDEANFWSTIYRKGLGEFCYRNKIDLDKVAKFPAKKKKADLPLFWKRKERVLLGIGGGKDSIVAGEWLKKDGRTVSGFVLETGKCSEIPGRVSKVMGITNPVVKRKLDPKVLRGMRDGYNGHIPISGIFAAIGFWIALLYDYRYVAVGNEQSSGEGNVHYQGETINHQWSKSPEFEALFQDYTSRFLTPDTVYFSALRPFYEIRLVREFTKHSKYFPVFTSCNRKFKVAGARPAELWCGECPKCAFMFLQLSAFLPKAKVVELFGKNLLDDARLLNTYRDLLGLGKLKPFDCVGTFEESRVAMQLSRKMFGKSLVTKEFGGVAVGDDVMAKVFATEKADTMPAPFKFLGMEKVLILGYGKEGQETKRYLKKFYPKLKVGVADEKEGPRYLEKQKDADLVQRTPGLPLSKITRPHQTATNIFFDEIRRKGNLIIGVTGSKGKSTTASLIYSILKAAGRSVELLGNIGKPMLSALMKPISKKTIFVLELSSYQLEDLSFSPDIAVVTSLFPEHMNHHGSLENYWEAKSQIWRHQSPEDSFIFNPAYPMLKKWAKESPAKVLPFDKKLPLPAGEIPLLGEHNVDNVRAATTVARALKVKESSIRKGIEQFKALPHRLQKVGEFKKILFYDDAISTTPESTIMALKALKKVDTIFLGGEDRGYDFKELEKLLRKLKVPNIVLFPNSGARILKTKKGFRILETKSMKNAVAFAFKHSGPGSICLLSTASPSYSLWENFEEKGDEFQKWVRHF